MIQIRRQLLLVVAEAWEGSCNYISKKWDKRNSSICSRNHNEIGRIVNNAGIVFVKKIIDTLEEEWDEIINTNLKGAFLCSKAALPCMIHKKSGVIINVSSGTGRSALRIYRHIVQANLY